jgi:hypothetical protein
VSPATVSRVLCRLGLNRITALEPAEPVRRYERERPGELIHIDIKKLGRFERTGHRITGDRAGQSKSRGIGWEYLHPVRRLRKAAIISPRSPAGIGAWKRSHLSGNISETPNW